MADENAETPASTDAPNTPDTGADAGEQTADPALGDQAAPGGVGEAQAQ